MTKTLLLSILLVTSAFAQRINIYGPAVAPGTPSSLAPKGTVLPSTCTIGDSFFKTDATAGANLYGCTATNVWTVQSGTGSVTSIDISVPGALLSKSGGPITTTGTITIALVSQVANCIFAGPTSGGSAAPSCRALVGADLPTSGDFAYNAATKALGVTGTIATGQVGTQGGVLFNGLTSGTATLIAPAVAGTPTITLPGVTSTLATTAGNVATATALAANPTNCSAGNYPLGIDANGNVENCTAASSPTVFVGTFTGAGPTTITAVTHGVGIHPSIEVFDSSGMKTDVPVNCKTAAGAAIGCGAATSNGDLVIGVVASDTYTYSIR